jgi:hypothetical protein
MVLATLAVLAPAREGLSVDLVQYVAPAILGAYGGLAARHFLTAGQFNGLISILLLVSGLILGSCAF